MKERSVATDITDALFELLKTKELPQITITELIKKAGVCRASFYRHFYLTEDVIRQYGTAMYEDINRKIPLSRTGIYEHILAVNTYLYSCRERLGLIEQRGLYHLLEAPILQQCVYQPSAWTSGATDIRPSFMPAPLPSCSGPGRATTLQNLPMKYRGSSIPW